MKTLNTIKALLAALAILFSVNLSAATFSFEEENYINDIPFNTNQIYNEILIESGMLDFNFVDEAYINDIPFSTEMVVSDYEYQIVKAKCLICLKKMMLMTFLLTLI